MEYITLIKANLKRQKSGFIGVLILIFIITVCLCAVLTTWNNANMYENEQINRMGYGDLTSWVSGVTDMEALVNQIEMVTEVEQTEVQESILTNYEVNGNEAYNGMLMTYEPDEYAYRIFTDTLSGFKDSETELKEGEILVTPALCSLYDVKIGSQVTIVVDQSGHSKQYTVAGYFEDPIMGSEMIGIKSMLMNQADYQTLKEEMLAAGTEANAEVCTMLHIYENENSTLSISDLQSELNQQTDLSRYTIFSYTKSNMVGFMLILQNIFVGFLMVFVFVLLIATMVVLGHSISSSIEQDYVNMGILKTMGFTKGKLRLVQMLQYIIAILAGMLLGIPISKLVVQLVNHITVKVSGLLIPTNFPFGICLSALLIVLIILIVFIYVKTIHIGKITPIKAIRGGSDNIYFKSHLNLPINQKGLSFWLALRQLVTGKKQYISACIVTALLVFFLALVGRISAWMGPDGEGLMNSFGAAGYDIAVSCAEDTMFTEVEEKIASYTQITGQFELSMYNTSLNGIDYSTNIISQPSYYNILRGRTCLYDNEIVITEFVASDLNINIGDTVTVSTNDGSGEYIISGIYQCANDMGSNFGMSMEGYQKLSASTVRLDICYILGDAGYKQEIADELESMYGSNVAVDLNTWSGLNSIVAVLNALEKLMYGIVILFILVVIVLTSSKILYKEEHDLGIYKSLGFISSRLQAMFALRFGVVAIVGSIIGIILSAVVTDPMTTMLLKMCGISRFSSQLTITQMIQPAVFVTMIFMIFAYVAARRIRKVDPAILITE